jgi:hypothetical protein
VGTATVAMILNGLGFSNRQLYLVSQFFATKLAGEVCRQSSRAWPLSRILMGGRRHPVVRHFPPDVLAGLDRVLRRIDAAPSASPPHELRQ